MPGHLAGKRMPGMGTDKVKAPRETDHTGQDRHLDGANAPGDYVLRRLGRQVAMGRIISSMDTPPCWKVPLYWRWY